MHFSCPSALFFWFAHGKRMNRRLHFASFLAMTLAACGGSKPASDPSSASSDAGSAKTPAESNVDIKTQAAREAHDLKPTEVKGDGYSFTALTSGKPSVKKIDGGIEV
jgi:hypothetical protein